MPSKWIEARATARASVAGLAIGLIALAGLTLWASLSMQSATAHLHELNETIDRWGQVVQHVDVADHAMADYLRAGTDIMRQPLATAAGAGEESLRWLQDHGMPADIRAAKKVSNLYGDYTTLLREMIALGDRGDTAQLQRSADQAELTVVSLRKQLTTVVQLRRLETTDYLKRADSQNRQLRLAAVGAFVIDLGLVSLCGMVLLGHRRKILRQAAKSEHQALHDALTGLANRTLLTTRTEEAIQHAHLDGAPLGLLLIDLDRFKPVNDTLGHPCGDRLLQHVANRLVAAVWEPHTVARLGGDEFAVLLPGIGAAANAVQVAERVHEALDAPVDLDGLSLEVSGSIGVAIYPTDSSNADELLKHADVAMYAAKRSHLATAVYESQLDQQSAAQLTVISDLRHAIDHGELVLHYQPKAAVRSGTICGAEVLTRWRHPQRGLLGPDQFIPAAEESGLIEPLTRYVLDNALAQCHSWQTSGWDVPVSVNVGAQCLHNQAFPEQVQAVLARYERSPDTLTLEITESAIISDPRRATDVLRRLKDLGVRLSIDDFGTGYSSIAHLRTMPVHEMKIDRSFTTNMRTDANSNAITRSLLGLAHNLKLEVVAEGVEDRETWTTLAALGCDIMQGYYLSKPLPAEDFATWLHQQAPGNTDLDVPRFSRDSLLVSDDQPDPLTAFEALGTYRTNATVDLALALEVPEHTSLFVHDRLLSIHDTPASTNGRRMTHRTYIPMLTCTRVQALADNPFRTPDELYTVLTDAGIKLRWTETVRATIPAPDDTTMLHVPPGNAVLITRRTTTDSEGRPLLLEETCRSAHDTQLTYPLTPAQLPI